ncbi:unnamed protein product [Linum tenue]|uniref:Uncharacterized protein n=1 Tax=Linum tenue TaxID=586396 RepID=A0AAV0I2B0_9ROSI|nr:unnamed protein product [Linum tenue]
MTAVSDKKAFPEANVDKELNPSHNKRVEVDSTSSSIAASLANKVLYSLSEKEEAEKKKASEDNKDRAESLKTTVIISVIFAAVAGAAFGIVKKLRERQT